MILACAAACAAASPPAASQASRVQRPTEVIDQANCVTSQCHANIKAFKVQHAPVAMNNCDTCHELADAGKHAFRYPREKLAMCAYCHEFDVSNVPVVHAPVDKGECTGCHDPHGGSDNRLFREKTLKELCFRCHEDVSSDDKHVHKPFADGGCDSCHASHASRFPKLLYAEGDALCLSCHDDFAGKIASVRFLHKAMSEGCSRCHLSHSSPNERLLRQPLVALCTDECHEDVKMTAMTAKYKHSAVLKDRACLTCHAAHGSDMADLMIQSPLKLCMTCHDRSVGTDRGYVVPALPELMDPKTIKHGPINDGLCNACHLPHGSNEAMLLVRANSNRFYQALDPANYKLCFTCHDIRMASERQTLTATQFRNGDENLHFVHVNDGSRGRNCRVCHSTHASLSPDAVNTSVQYGKWKMPLDFVKTATGGACTKSCHPPYRYDREHPVIQPSTRPASRPSSPLAVASAQPAAPAAFAAELTSVAGKRLRIPRQDRPTVLVFTHAGHAQQEDLLKQLAAAVPNPLRAQVIVILGGDNLGDEAKRMSRATLPTFAIVADPSHELFDRLEVNVWPTIVVLRPNGTQAWRSAGVSQTLWMTLSAHVDFAAGKIDHAALLKQLAIATAIGDASGPHAARELAAARHLLAAGEAEKARKLLEQTLAAHPTSAELRVELVRAYLELNQSADALAQLDRLPPRSMPPGQAEVLRAAALLKEFDWSQAAAVLAPLTAKYPDLADAHYLLGQIYEHDLRWQDAAREYKLARDCAAAARQP